MSLDFDASDLIESLSTGRYLVTRRAAATTDGHGRAVAGSETSFTITGNYQPATGTDLQRLPEGRRTIESRVLFTTTELLTGGQGAAFEADLVNLDGELFEVELVQRWAGGGSNRYFRCIVQRKGAG